jgi:hypothetical protein
MLAGGGTLSQANRGCGDFEDGDALLLYRAGWHDVSVYPPSSRHRLHFSSEKTISVNLSPGAHHLHTHAISVGLAFGTLSVVYLRITYARMPRQYTPTRMTRNQKYQ